MFRKRIKVVIKGEEAIRSLSVHGFEKEFGVVYLSHLRFVSGAVRKEVKRECPILLSWTPIGARCRDLARQYREQLHDGFVEDIIIGWIDDKIGYGLFAHRDIEPNEYLGQYTGFLTRYWRHHPNKNPYCMHYPTKWWSWHYWMVDAAKAGNEMRFANHSEMPNCRVECLLKDQLLHFVFFSDQIILKGQELTIDYGPDFRF